jgi:hypothetical protein
LRSLVARGLSRTAGHLDARRHLVNVIAAVSITWPEDGQLHYSPRLDPNHKRMVTLRNPAA